MSTVRRNQGMRAAILLAAGAGAISGAVPGGIETVDLRHGTDRGSFSWSGGRRSGVPSHAVAAMTGKRRRR